METTVIETIKLIILEGDELSKYLYLSLPLQEQINLASVFSAFDINEIKLEIREHRPEVLLIGGDRFDDRLAGIVYEVCREYPRLGVVLLLSSYCPNDSAAVRKIALESKGGFAVLLRQSLVKLEQFIGVIKAVKYGQYMFDPGLASYMFTREGNSPFLEQLTNREKETLNLLAEGYNNAAIAEVLYIDIKTVEHHLNSIYAKMKNCNDIDKQHPRVTAARLYLQEVGIGMAVAGRHAASGVKEG
jgi:DNA-binding NarL/FixJ family response regulator